MKREPLSAAAELLEVDGVVCALLEEAAEREADRRERRRTEPRCTRQRRVLKARHRPGKGEGTDPLHERLHRGDHALCLANESVRHDLWAGRRGVFERRVGALQGAEACEQSDETVAKPPTERPSSAIAG